MRLVDLLGRKRPIFTAEFLPPRQPDLEGLLQRVREVSGLVDALSISDPKASMEAPRPYRMDPFYTAMRLRQLTGLEIGFHLTPRDANRNAIMGTVMAAVESRLQNILVVRGDRYGEAKGKMPAKNVYDFASASELISAIRSLEGDLGGQPSEKFCIGVACDPTVVYRRSRRLVEAEVGRLLRKQDAGADFVQTQPVFDARFFEFRDIARERGVKMPFFAGMIPLKSYEDCLTLEERYGMRIPAEVKNQLRSPDQNITMKLCLKTLETLLANNVEGIHIYPRENPAYVKELLALK